MKKSFLIFLIIILVIAIIVVYYFIFNNKITYQDTLVINLNDKLPSKITYNDNKESSITWDNIDSSKKGSYEGSFKVHNKVYKIKLIIDDLEAPTIIGVKDLQIGVNEKIDLLKDIKVIDNSQKDITPVVKGDYDLSKTGKYNLYYEATDESGNTTKEEFTLEVVANITTTIPFASGNLPSSNDNYVLGKSPKGYTIEVINGVTYVDGILIANKTYPLPSDYAPGFNQEANKAYDLLRQGALKEDFNIYTLNSYRSYIDQKIIYNDYVARDGQLMADTYSARPGYSEHQSGLAIDVNSLDQNWENTPEGKWLSANCYKYGFIIRYPKGKEDITGYMYEPWHIRYVGKDLAEKLYNNGNWLTLEEYLGITSVYPK